MRLKRGKSSYRLPKDFSYLQSVNLRAGTFQLAVQQIHCAAMDSIIKNSELIEIGIPVYFAKKDNGFEFVLFPTPDKSYYVDISYFSLKRV